MKSIPTSSTLALAGSWFLHSGIQETTGGVARYYNADAQANLPVSNEITGYAASALTFLHTRTGDPAYLEAATQAARFLADRAWSSADNTFPFEPGSKLAYFFDLGIIARGLMAVHGVTSDASLRARAEEAALSLAFDFMGDSCFYPIITLPEKEPLAEEPRWSRKPGCFQLKAALIWKQFDNEHAHRMFDVALAMALATHESFLDEPDRERLMDRLHAYSYFLEALLASPEHPEAREALALGLSRAAGLLREIAPLFERSDVNAQLLRVRLIAHHLDILPLDAAAAAEEAARVESFQEMAGPLRLRGGFWFGRKAGRMLPYSNPVSTAFCMQALALWQDHQESRWKFSLSELI